MNTWNLFRSPITFSITAEDHNTVSKALEIKSTDSVVCIASSGDTPLNLLQNGPKRVRAVDFSFGQICLGVLKAEGLRRLSLAEYHGLLGVVPCKQTSSSAYDKLRPHLSAPVRSFWDQNRHLIVGGVLWTGGVQRTIRLASSLLRVALGQNGLIALKSIRSREAALDFIQRYVSKSRFRLASRLVLNTHAFRLFYPEIGFRHLPLGLTPYDFCMDRVTQMLLNRPIAENDMIQAFLFGKFPLPDRGLPYFHSELSQSIRANLESLTFHHGDLSEFLQAEPPGTIDCFALCNAVDWMPMGQVPDLFERILVAARPNARVLMYSRQATIDVPERLVNQLVCDLSLSRELIVEDRLGYYRTIAVYRVSK